MCLHTQGDTSVTKNLLANKIQNLHYTVQRTYTPMYHTQESFGGVTKTMMNGLI